MEAELRAHGFLADRAFLHAGEGVAEGRNEGAGNDPAELAAAILVAVPIYFVLTIKMGAVGRKDLLALPKGTLFVRVAEKCRLIH